MLSTTIRSFRSISTKTALVLTNSLPIEKRALVISTLASIKNHCAENELVQELLCETNIVKADFDPPCAYYLAQLAAYVNVKLNITCSNSTGAPTLLPDTANNFFIFTDGSKTEDGVGYATILTASHGIMATKSRRMPSLCGIFEAEAHAIHAALKMTAGLLPPGSTVSIFSDSKSSLQALASAKKTIPIIAKTQKLAHDLANSFSVRFHWIPGHSGIPGNELADQKARAAASNRNAPTKKVKISWSNAKHPLNHHLRQKWSSEWANENTSSLITKRFSPSIESSKILKFLKPTHQLIQVLSGHSRLHTFLHRIGVEQEDTCGCHQGPETLEHFLFHCPIFHTHRIAFKNHCTSQFSTWPPPFHLITSKMETIRKMQTFIIASKRLNFDYVDQ